MKGNERMNIIKQSCKIIEHERVVILCDSLGYKTVKSLIDDICNTYFEFDPGEFIMTDYDDYVISCKIRPFVELTCAVFEMYEHKKITKIPNAFLDIFDKKEYQSVYEAIQRRRNMSDLSSLKLRSDGQHYEFLSTNDYVHMSNESKYAHIIINIDVITDILCASRLESNKVFKNADTYDSNMVMWMFSHYEDNTFIRPGEMDENSPLYKSWISLCEQAYDLQKSMIQDKMPTNVAKSLLPSSAAKQVQCGATLGDWYLFMKNAYLSSMGHLSQNMRDLLLMIIDLFDLKIVPEEMSSLLMSLKQDIETYEWLPF